MYPVTTEFQNKIKETTRIFKLSVQIQHSTGTLELTDKDIVGGSVVFTESSQVGDDFSIGGTVASIFETEIFRKPEHNSIEFEGATIIPQVGLLLSHVDTDGYFLTAPQPTEFDEPMEDVWEYVPLGVFNVDEINKSRNSIRFKAIDNMVELDKPYSLSSLSYPANLYQIYQNICSVADIQPATTSFVNQNYIVQTKPEGDYSLRDILSFVAELSGCFARMNRTGALELVWYTSTDLTLTGANRFDFKPREDLIQIKGIKFETEDTVYIAGTDEYVVDLTDNPLLQSDFATVISNIYNKVNGTIFTPYESRWQGNPAIQTGDIITQVDRDGNSHTTLVTHSTYKYRGASTLAARGLPLKAKGYKGSTNKKISNIVRKEIKPIGDKLTSLEQAQLNATELIANMLGGYAFYEADGFYVADNPVLANATKVWKWGIGGFGYSENGLAGPYTTAISADGTIVAMLVAANIITADMVKTGILSSEDDSTWINLNDGTFNFKNLLKYVDGVLTMPAQELPANAVRSDAIYNGTYIGTTEGIKVEFTNGGRAIIGSGGITVQHNDGSYTKIDGRGIMRLFSIPIFGDVPSGTSIIENFESGNINNTRIDIPNCEAGYGPVVKVATDYMFVEIAAKYAGSYGLRITQPPPETIITGTNPYDFAYASHQRVRFLNYRPTKDSTFSMMFKSDLKSQFTTIQLIIDDLDYPEIPNQVINLSSSTWSLASALLTGGHTYSIMVRINTMVDTDDTGTKPLASTVWIDDVTFETNVNESVIVGYEEGTKPYNDFTYIKQATFPANTSQIQVTLPDYFRGMDYTVFLQAAADWYYTSNSSSILPSITLLSINNKVPSFTAACTRYPTGSDVTFTYIVTLVEH